MAGPLSGMPPLFRGVFLGAVAGGTIGIGVGFYFLGPAGAVGGGIAGFVAGAVCGEITGNIWEAAALWVDQAIYRRVLWPTLVSLTVAIGIGATLWSAGNEAGVGVLGGLLAGMFALAATSTIERYWK